MNRAQWRVAGLLFCSGACALVYQTAWMRQFRLIFGASTFATAAVLAIFMGGLGLGSAILGKRADRSERPLALYAKLELLIALAAALSPFLLWIAAQVYWSTGGSPRLGLAGASLVRLALSLLVLGVPTFLMGGTLPAAARAVATEDDRGRRSLALLYGLNTLGAVAGTLLSTFVLLERLGNRMTLFAAVIVNVIVALAALAMSRRLPQHASEARDETSEAARVPPRAVYAAAAIAGFTFLLMELVWYRMLSPLLGGTTYMFGLILAVALLGIGLGGAAYALLRGNAPASVAGFAVTCAFEALAIGIPFALGDRLAMLMLALSDHAVLGFGASVVSWTIVTLIVVFPAAFISGVQFPLLVALLGRGREDIGREAGAAYAWNTAGAIAGSLAGGFGLLPLLSATGAWQLGVMLLAFLAVISLLFALRERRLGMTLASAAAALLAVLTLSAEGPTAVWRHSGIGVGRAAELETRNGLIDWMRWRRRIVLWEADGRESGVALVNSIDPAFIVNGKSDGSARRDAGTQVMCGLVGAAYHPRPSAALVVGLGTGSTAGWLAAIDTMERVDVVELEPVVLDVARASQLFNHDAMRNPKMHVTIGDAREVLLTNRRTYDVIASEPSNPYRAGIASLFTREFYSAAAERLSRGGVFAQWVQTYEIAPETIRTIYATLLSVFPHVHTWQTSEGDVLLIASREPLRIDIDALRARLAREPFRSALRYAWRTEGPEGFFTHFVANEEFAKRAAQQAEAMNTDDRTVIEFGFARSIAGSENLLPRLRSTAQAMGLARPLHVRGTFSPQRPFDADALARNALRLANEGREEAVPVIDRLRAVQPAEAESLMGRLRLVQQQRDAAARHLVNAMTAYRTQPWADPAVMHEAIESALTLAAEHPPAARPLFAALGEPFAGGMLDDDRKIARALIAGGFAGCGGPTIGTLLHLEPHTPFRREILELRARCYAAIPVPDLAPFAAKAKEEWEVWRGNDPGGVVQ